MGSRVDTFISSAEICLDTDLSAKTTIVTHTRVVAEYYDSEYTEGVPQIIDGKLVTPLKYCIDIKHSNGVEIDPSSIKLDNTHLPLCDERMVLRHSAVLPAVIMGYASLDALERDEDNLKETIASILGVKVEQVKLENVQETT